MGQIDMAPMLHPQVDAVCVIISEEGKQLPRVDVSCQVVQ